MNVRVLPAQMLLRAKSRPHSRFEGRKIVFAIHLKNTARSRRSTCQTVNGRGEQWHHRHAGFQRICATAIRRLSIRWTRKRELRFFDLLLKIGVKEIEVGFPSAGATEFDFISGLVKSGRIPDDVVVQVLTQSREDLIRTSFNSLRGARAAIVHLYNAVSPMWRRIVFQMETSEIRDIAITGAKILRDEAAKQPDTEWHFEYSPETFSTAELDFSLECCAAVMEILKPTPERPIIFNLPATVEAATPNIYADQIEYFGRNIPNRESVIISLHTHNDRGTGVAATELRFAGWSRPVERLLVWQWRTHRQCRSRYRGAQHVHAGRKPRPRFFGHR